MQGAPATTKNLRVFGIAFAVVWAALAIFCRYVWKWESAGTWMPIFLVLAGLFLLPALFAPQALKPLYGPWMKFGLFLGIIMTAVMMTVLYIIVLPVFSLIRLKDPLRFKMNKDPKASYWEPHTMSESTIERFSRPF